MCRFVAYNGLPILLEHLVTKPSNSLVAQSVCSQETEVKTNGDGFGLGWYAPEIDNIPGLFTSILPAWNDKNLISLCSKITSPCRNKNVLLKI